VVNMRLCFSFHLYWFFYHCNSFCCSGATSDLY